MRTEFSENVEVNIGLLDDGEVLPSILRQFPVGNQVVEERSDSLPAPTTVESSVVLLVTFFMLLLVVVALWIARIS